MVIFTGQYPAVESKHIRQNVFKLVSKSLMSSIWMIRNERLFGPGAGDNSKALGLIVFSWKTFWKVWSSDSSISLHIMDLYNVLSGVLPLRTQWIKAEFGPFIFVIKCSFFPYFYCFLFFWWAGEVVAVLVCPGKLPWYASRVCWGFFPKPLCLTVWLFARKNVKILF